LDRDGSSMTSPPPTTRWPKGRRILTPAASAAAAGLVALAVGMVAESLIIHAVHGNRQRLEWLSDAVISTGVAGVTYLWLHLKALRTRVLALEREQIVLGEQLRLAAEIQRNLLPVVPEATDGFRWAARMIPAGQIGGDFYDFLQPADGTILTIVCDVSGKGVPAALILSSLKTLFRSVVRETVDPALIAERIAAALYEEHGGLPYATAIVARFDLQARSLVYVNAGHPAGYLLQSGVVRVVLESGGQPLGLLPRATYVAAQVSLMPGDVGVFVTDGITEALDGGRTTPEPGLVHSLQDLSLSAAPDELCDRLLSLTTGSGDRSASMDWQDDRTVFAFAVEPTALAPPQSAGLRDRS
jgi:hypothetical protein